MNKYYNNVVDILNKFNETQMPILEKITSKIVDKIENGGKFYVFGTGHSHMVGEEFYARAGGLACVYLIAPMELTLGEHPLKSTSIERIKEYASVIKAQYKITKDDVILISSNSGRNAMIVEMAKICKEQGTLTIAFTNLTHSKSVTSRHECGENLYQVSDYVIDNCGVIGDAMMELEGVRGKMGSTSSIVGMFMAQSLSMMIASEMHKRELIPPVFLSANVDAGDDWNDQIMKEYYNV